MKTAPPFLPGDKVRVKHHPEHPYSAWVWFSHRLNYSELPDLGVTYCVRKAFTEPTSGRHGVYLNGIHGVFLQKGKRELGFPAEAFHLVSRCREACPPLPPDEVLCFDVKVPPRIADLLSFVDVEAWAPLHCREYGHENGRTIADRWKKKSPHHGVGVPFETMHRRLQQETASGAAVTIEVPLHPLVADELLEIAAALEIEPEAWLQGVLGNLASRVSSLHTIERRQANFEARKTKRRNR